MKRITIDWVRKRKSCKICNGTGYVQSEMRHENGRQSHAWAVLCECRPQTLQDVLQAALQESQYIDKYGEDDLYRKL